MKPLHVGIVGAGIVGLAHAWAAARRGHQVSVFERSPRAVGASVRNFGMIWPIGQAASPQDYQSALLSRELWLQLGKAAGVWVKRCGSVHLAHREDEWTVLQEFHARAEPLGVACELLDAEQVRGDIPAANPDGLCGGLLSQTELCVNPRRALEQIPQWLTVQYGITFQFNRQVCGVESGPWAAVTLAFADRERLSFDRVIVCGGTETQALFPGLLADSPLKACKLQMLKTRPQPVGWNSGPHIAGGLTLRHYANFQNCPSLSRLTARIAAESPELDRFGIHVMASQNDRGEMILGDSHEYGEEITPFDRAEIDDLILRELRRILRLPDWTIAERWHGLYLKHPRQSHFVAEPIPGVQVVTGTGGAGMTLSFGLAERDWQEWDRIC